VQLLHRRYEVSLDTDEADKHGNKLRRSRHPIIEYTTKSKTKGHVVDWSKCRYDTHKGFQAERDLTYLKKSFRDGVRKAGKADSLLDNNCMRCSRALLPVHEGGNVA
jgi:hypothetical protein